MTAVAILVQNVSKKYRLFASPAERIKEVLHPFGRTYHKEFWALKDVSFEVPKGQTVGILGRNGSGKSTLLEIISGILTPSSGAIRADGRISALLQLGAGFNPEFTGRENVILNCILLGFDRDEARERLPEIEAFAGIGQFIDQPVKTYSSGMFARLAFSTAIHVDPEIMIIDEILAVGDARFQEQCYGRLQDFSDRGNTTLFVSHDVNAVIAHCDHAILLHEGRIVAQGAADKVADQYIELLYGTKHAEPAPVSTAPVPEPSLDAGSPLSRFLAEDAGPDALTHRRTFNPSERVVGSLRAHIVDFLLLSELDGEDPVYLTPGTGLTVLVKVKFPDPSARPCQFGFSLRTVDGIQVFGVNSVIQKEMFQKIDCGDSVIFRFGLQMIVHEGDFFMDIGVYHERGHDVDILSLRRRGVHLKVLTTPTFAGLANLATKSSTFCEPSRWAALLDPVSRPLP